MNKKELIKIVAGKTHITQKAAGEIIETAIETIEEAMEKREKVQLVGFGTFETRDRGARPGKNPQTGEWINVGATIVPAFKAGKPLKERVNKR